MVLPFYIFELVTGCVWKLCGVFSRGGEESSHNGLLPLWPGHNARRYGTIVSWVHILGFKPRSKVSTVWALRGFRWRSPSFPFLSQSKPFFNSPLMKRRAFTESENVGFACPFHLLWLVSWQIHTIKKGYRPVQTLHN